MSQNRDIALLRRFEPIISFTRGESFFPMDVEPYVRTCSLWVQRRSSEPEQLVPRGKLDLTTLAYPYPDEFGTVHYLKFAEPLGAAEMAAQSREQILHPERNLFHPGKARLARVGYISRFIDALFSLSLLARGRVPGDSAAAAIRAYEQLATQNPTHIYHGRVVRQSGWLVLQYWFFYPFNNWRSGFFGANDHESDWEMICLYLSEEEATGAVEPAWIAYASHDYHGDDLRRRWDDPELEKVDDHPVVYAGAGSHASYFQSGEYLTELELAIFAPLTRLFEQVRSVWRTRLRQYEGDDFGEDEQHRSTIFRIPFVDYARGDGLVIGPGQHCEWGEPRLLNPTPPWVSMYRGLWGLYTQDPFAGEDAPAGPMYNRDGTVRRAWYDPVGWAGLDKVTPTDEVAERVEEEKERIRDRQVQTRTTVDEMAAELQRLGVQAAAMRTQPHLYKPYLAHQERMKELSQEINTLRAQLAADEALLDALSYYADQLRAGADPEPLRSHLQRAHRPVSDETLRAGLLAEYWAAISVGLLMLIFLALITIGRQYLALGLLMMIALYAFIEAGFRGRLIRFVTSVTISTAVLSALVLAYEYFWEIVETGVLVMGIYILWENLRELVRR
ncbi:MAG TPA: hypothetical protein P5121_07190 [Caldilineaceae bacterium]|nr:hypothetical protein [Caldilineaceae bacterium]